MQISKLLAAFLLLLVLPVGGQELPEPLRALLLSAQGQAQACLGLHEPARELFRKSVDKGGPAEPLIRSLLLSGDKTEARKVYLQQREKLDATEEKLLGLLLTDEKASEESLKLQIGGPHHSLYLGLVLRKLGRPSEARPDLSKFVSSGEWGFELAESFLLEEAPARCEACREEPTSRHIGAAGVCASCYALLRDPIWIEQSVVQPTEEQKRMLSNMSGEHWDGLGDLAATANLKKQTALIPQKSQDELESKLDAEAKELLETARSRWGKELDAANLGQALAEGKFDENLFASPLEQQECHEKFSESSSQVGLDWLLNVANWLTELTPAKPQGISKRQLLIAARASTGQPDITLGGMSMLVGSAITEEQYQYFEERLAEHPDDLFLRRVLAEKGLGFLGKEQQDRRLIHELWLIEHCPELSDSSWNGQVNDSNNARLLRAWSAKLEQQPENTSVLAGAANFFRSSQQELSLGLYRRCLELEPNNPKWPREVLFQLSLMTDKDTDWDQLEAILEQSAPATRGLLLCTHLLDVFEAEDYARAKRLAGELLEYSSTHQDWNSGNAHHKAHTVLGLLALKDGNLAVAEHHLIQSASTEGSPQLNSFGPNMSLAKALLEHDASENVVKEFLDLCSRFWENDSLIYWRSQIEAGHIPDFGANLRY